MKREKCYTFDLVSIDAWRNEVGGWDWNNSFNLERGIVFVESTLTPRKILAALRKWEYLSEASKGNLNVEFVNSGFEIIEIQTRSHKPLLALMEVSESE